MSSVSFNSGTRFGSFCISSCSITSSRSTRISLSTMSSPCMLSSSPVSSPTTSSRSRARPSISSSLCRRISSSCSMSPIIASACPVSSAISSSRSPRMPLRVSSSPLRFSSSCSRWSRSPSSIAITSTASPPSFWRSMLMLSRAASRSARSFSRSARIASRSASAASASLSAAEVSLSAAVVSSRRCSSSAHALAARGSSASMPSHISSALAMGIPAVLTPADDSARSKELLHISRTCSARRISFSRSSSAASFFFQSLWRSSSGSWRCLLAALAVFMRRSSRSRE
mmetsp:Transcript_20661/g.50936  ORF Transcript_20661/g.50936 Transcript_20661/m.50936 type:complete len:286 (-) Transcript_20661:735-1592(-)